MSRIVNDAFKKTHKQHEGELYVQRMRHVPSQLTRAVERAIETEMSPQHAEFIKDLPYLPLGTLDSGGNLWATILCHPKTTVLSSDALRIEAKIPPGDPFAAALLSQAAGPRYFASVGIDFTNRGRVKLAGIIDHASMADTLLTLELVTNENIGNCPKYITVRNLQPKLRQSETIHVGKRLNEEALAVVRQASTLFIATRHLVDRSEESDLGFNHRGGPKGFVRYFEDALGAHLVLPDYSGNRFYQSLGNVQSDHAIGVVIPDFLTGHLLHLHGKAQNLFDADASDIMPGATLVTVITLADSVLVKNSMNLELVGEEEYSPYNPKLRLLKSELGDQQLQTLELEARLISAVRESKQIMTFTFQLPSRVDVVAGGYAIFDFSHLATKNYQHMNDMNPRSLNDDYVRTWTVSKTSEDGTQISITVKKSGVISSFLHSFNIAKEKPLDVVLRGFGGDFTCFKDGQLETPKMLWVAGGVGITPFLAMYRRLIASGVRDFDIDLCYSCRGDEVALIDGMDRGIRIRVFDSGAHPGEEPTAPYKLFSRRLQEQDLGSISNLSERTAFLCGPPTFMAAVRGWLQASLDPQKIRFEAFDF